MAKNTFEAEVLFNPFMYNVEKMAKHTVKILQHLHRRILKLCLIIFQHYA